MIRRIMFIFIALLVLAMISLTYSFFALQKTSVDLAKVEKRRVESYLIAYELRQSSTDLAAMARAYAANPDPLYEEIFDKVANIRDGDAEVPEEYHRIYWDYVLGGNAEPRPSTGVKRSLVERAKDAGMKEDEIALINRSFQLSDDLIAIEHEAFNAVKGIFKSPDGLYSKLGKPNKEYAQSLLHSREFYAEKVKIMGAIDDFFQLMERHIAEEIQVQVDKQALLRMLFAVSAVLALILLYTTVYLVVMQNRRDLAEREAAQRAAEEENEQLNDSVINILEAVNALSQRDLTIRAPVTEDIIGTVSDSINGLTTETANVLLGVTDIAGEVANVSGNVKYQADQVSQTAEEERKRVEDMVNSLLDATQTMNQVAALAEQSNESAGEATKVTNEALDTVNQTVVGMDAIRETISETEKRIKRLGERSQEISGIVNLINTISERTHVLALNASMQAAVAGEAGRGFAVVAEEVQRLAESSRNATQQIATLVNNIQVETNETINTVNETIGQVVEGSAQAQRAGEQMRLTQEITGQLVSQVQSIAAASDQQKEMSGTLLEAVQRIGDSTEQTAQQIEEQNKETESLLKASSALVDSVSVFRLPARDGSGASS